MIYTLSTNAYLWLKAWHLIAVIAWMAGLFYLPRLFVYHCQTEIGSERSETFKIMERRLYAAIMMPAMVVSLALGIIMLFAIPFPWPLWLWIKIVCALGMLGLHFAMAAWKNDFAQDRNQHPEKFYRLMNEGPTVLMMIIVIMVIVRPF
jgi:putative membrane protein